MRILIKKYHGEYEVIITVSGIPVWSWNLVMDVDGEYESAQFAPHE